MTNLRFGLVWFLIHYEFCSNPWICELIYFFSWGKYSAFISFDIATSIWDSSYTTLDLLYMFHLFHIVFSVFLVLFHTSVWVFSSNLSFSSVILYLALSTVLLKSSILFIILYPLFIISVILCLSSRIHSLYLFIDFRYLMRLPFICTIEHINHSYFKFCVSYHIGSPVGLILLQIFILILFLDFL